MALYGTVPPFQDPEIPIEQTNCENTELAVESVEALTNPKDVVTRSVLGTVEKCIHGKLGVQIAFVLELELLPT